MEQIFVYIITIIAFKAIFIGSDFNFIAWIKYGKKYTDWYNARETFSNLLIEENN